MKLLSRLFRARPRVLPPKYDVTLLHDMGHQIDLCVSHDDLLHLRDNLGKNTIFSCDQHVFNLRVFNHMSIAMVKDTKDNNYGGKDG